MRVIFFKANLHRARFRFTPRILWSMWCTKATRRFSETSSACDNPGRWGRRSSCRSLPGRSLRALHDKRLHIWPIEKLLMVQCSRVPFQTSLHCFSEGITILNYQIAIPICFKHLKCHHGLVFLEGKPRLGATDLGVLFEDFGGCSLCCDLQENQKDGYWLFMIIISIVGTLTSIIMILFIIISSIGINCFYWHFCFHCQYHDHYHYHF